MLVLDFDSFNEFSLFALNVEHVYLLARFERVVVWSEVCTVQRLVGVTKLMGSSRSRGG